MEKGFTKLKHSRTKKGVIEADGRLTYSSVKINDNEAELSFDYGVTLHIEMNHENWQKLAQYIEKNPDGFIEDFIFRFVNPVLDEIKGHNKRKDKQKFLYKLRIELVVLYAFFQYWCKKDSRGWPEHLNKILKQVKMSNPFILTQYCIEKVYQKEIEEFSLCQRRSETVLNMAV